MIIQIPENATKAYTISIIKLQIDHYIYSTVFSVSSPSCLNFTDSWLVHFNLIELFISKWRQIDWIEQIERFISYRRKRGCDWTRRWQTRQAETPPNEIYTGPTERTGKVFQSNTLSGHLPQGGDSCENWPHRKSSTSKFCKPSLQFDDINFWWKNASDNIFTFDQMLDDNSEKTAESNELNAMNFFANNFP